jgi:hypothetical protein
VVVGGAGGVAQIQTRKNEIVNRLEKTKRWEETDLQVQPAARVRWRNASFRR